MKTINILYDKSTKFIKDIGNKFNDVAYIEFYNVDYTKDKKSARKYQEDFGSKNLPLIIFEDENLDYVAGIWSESDPEWEKEIIKKLSNV